MSNELIKCLPVDIVRFLFLLFDADIGLGIPHILVAIMWLFIRVL